MRLNVSEKAELTGTDLQTWKETLTVFSWKTAPFTHLLYEMLNPERGHMVATFLGTTYVPEWLIAATNGKRLFLVKERFLPLPIDQRIFLLAHEVGHPMLGHIVASNYYRQRGYIQIGLKKMPWNDMLANFAQDFVINDMLIQSRIGQFVPGGCHDTSIATYRDSWIDVYEKLLKECQAQKKSGQSKLLDGNGNPIDPGKGKGPEQKGEQGEEMGPETGAPSRGNQRPMDGHMGFGEGEPKPGQGQEPDTEDEVELNGSNEWVSDDDLHREQERARMATAAAMELAKARGQLPLALKMFCDKVLEPTVSWEDHLMSQFARKLGSGGYDFRRPDRRFLVRDIIVPGRTGFSADLVIIGLDSSGSIYGVPSLVNRWFAETSGILEQIRPKEIHVVWCDAKVHRVDIITDPADLADCVSKGAVGGGGTRFEPAIEYAIGLNRNIDCMAYLTDGYGSFPKEPPPFPIIWGSTTADKSIYPYGDVVHIPV